MEQSVQSPSPEAAPALPIRQPNLFELRGQGVVINFSASSISGQPLFTYTDRERQVNRSGDEIRQVQTEIGTLVTITLELTVDTGSVEFTLLVPRVRLPNNNEVRISTVGILTNNRLPLVPLPGQLQTYSTVKLAGTARFVFF